MVLAYLLGGAMRPGAESSYQDWIENALGRQPAAEISLAGGEVANIPPPIAMIVSRGCTRHAVVSHKRRTNERRGLGQGSLMPEGRQRQSSYPFHSSPSPPSPTPCFPAGWRPGAADDCILLPTRCPQRAEAIEATETANRKPRWCNAVVAEGDNSNK